MSSPHCLIFDFGNVIAFFDHLRACRQLARLASRDLTEHEVYDAIFESGLEAQYDRGEIVTESFLRAVRQRLGIDAEADQIARAWSDIFRPNDVVTSLIPKLRAARFRLILASNTNELHYEHFRVQFADVLRHFDRLVLSHEIEARKPDTRFFEACLEASGTPAKQCIYVDDREDFVEAGRRLGMCGIVYHEGTDLGHCLKQMGVHLP